MQVLRLYLTLMTVVWLGVLLAVVFLEFLDGFGDGNFWVAIVLSWGCFWRRWERWAFYGSLLPVLNVLIAGVAWDVQTR
ncbi:hypothetical protein [Gloeomargarita lithophora]|uniref:hypothetical protein n=1 Tax=Gloeomargarita lithophora TaxID=1188228 RepID=UPI0008F8631A|nr:hypothetical protein [Gloeomargarita lithophora]